MTLSLSVKRLLYGECKHSMCTSTRTNALLRNHYGIWKEPPAMVWSDFFVLSWVSSKKKPHSFQTIDRVLFRNFHPHNSRFISHSGMFLTLWGILLRLLIKKPMTYKIAHSTWATCTEATVTRLVPNHKYFRCLKIWTNVLQTFRRRHVIYEHKEINYHTCTVLDNSSLMFPATQIGINFVSTSNWGFKKGQCQVNFGAYASFFCTKSESDNWWIWFHHACKSQWTTVCATTYRIFCKSCRSCESAICSVSNMSPTHRIAKGKEHGKSLVVASSSEIKDVHVVMVNMQWEGLYTYSPW